nr:uncharacterized protein LOC117360536 isoform X2 [Geotrypetes seraphini]
MVELKQELAIYGLDTRGRKPELVRRLKDYLEENDTEQDGEEISLGDLEENLTPLLVDEEETVTENHCRKEENGISIASRKMAFRSISSMTKQERIMMRAEKFGMISSEEHKKAARAARVMPHTKRKGTVKANSSLMPLQTSSPTQQSLDHCTVKLLNQMPVVLPAGRLEEGASTALRLDTSLSTPENLPLLCLAGERGEMTLLGLAKDAELKSLEGRVSLIEPKDLCQGSIEPPAVGSTVVTLDTFWKAIQNLTDLVFKSTQETTLLVSKMDNLSKSLEVNKQETLAHFVQVIKDVAGLKDLTSAIIKDDNTIHQKLKRIENFNRRLNLRLLNFPRMSEITPVDLLRKYFLEILDFSSTNIPSLNKVYLLYSSKKRSIGFFLSGKGELWSN